MRLPIVLTVLVVSIAAGAAPAEAQRGRWVSGSNGYLPPNAFQGGHEADGKPLFVCRAQYNGGLHIGKIRADWRDCNIPWGGREILVRSYQVLTW